MAFFCFSVGTTLILYKFVMMPQRVLRANQFFMPCRHVCHIFLIPPLLNEISSLKQQLKKWQHSLLNNTLKPVFIRRTSFKRLLTHNYLLTRQTDRLAVCNFTEKEYIYTSTFQKTCKPHIIKTKTRRNGLDEVVRIS